MESVDFCKIPKPLIDYCEGVFSATKKSKQFT